MNVKTLLRVWLAILFIGFSAIGCGDPTDPASVANNTIFYPPSLSMCQVQMTFYQEFYTNEGYVWDTIYIVNGQSNSAKLLITFEGTDIEAFSHTISGLHDNDYEIHIPAGNDILIQVEYKNVNDDWVGCPANPVYLSL